MPIWIEPFLVLVPAGEKGRIHPPGAKIAEEGMVTGGWHLPWVIITAVVSLPIWGVLQLQLVRSCAAQHKLKRSPGELRALL